MDDVHERIKSMIDSLPVLSYLDLADSDDSCPICLTSFTSLMQDDNPHSGITKLTACNHLFCRKDLVQWIESRHGNCPTCRYSFLDILPPSESDDESSDGGEYIPNEHELDVDDDDDDLFIDTDGFSDITDFVSDSIVMESHIGEDSSFGSNDDLDNEEMEDGINWGLRDGNSSSMSDDENYGASYGGNGVGVALGADVNTWSGNRSNDGNEDENQACLAPEPK